MLPLSTSPLLALTSIPPCSLPTTNARRALVRLSLYGRFVPRTESSGVVFALLLHLETRIIRVLVPVILVVMALIFVLEISPMETSVLWPVPPKLKTSRLRLLTEQTLRRGGGETKDIFGAESSAPVTYGHIPPFGRRLFLLGPVFRVTPTRTLRVSARQWSAILKCLDVIRPTVE